jgi:hypothetical protein
MKAITTKFLPATSHRGPRVTAFDANRNRIVIAWDDEFDAGENHKAAALALCRKMDWQMPIVGGWIKEGMCWVFAP